MKDEVKLKVGNLALNQLLSIKFDDSSKMIQTMDAIIVTHVFQKNIDEVWEALSEESQLRKWYFPVRNYKFEIGNVFEFYESEVSNKFLHRCKILNIIPKQLIEYSWTHPEQSKGYSVLKWELEAVGQDTRITLTHSGVENFADAGPDFSRANYEMGWNAIVKNLLRNYLYRIHKLEFAISINAPANLVWEKLWFKENYGLWTEPFCPDSYFTGNLKAGERIHFLSPSGEGMYADVYFFKENKVIIFKHIGMMKDNKELAVDAETEKWTGAFESYFLKEEEGVTTVKVEIDTMPEYFEFNNTTYPKALERLKQICE